MKWYEKQKASLTQKGGTKEVEETYKDNENKEVIAANPLDSSEEDVKEASTTKTLSQETSIIHKFTTLNGDIDTDDNVIIYGTLNGNIICHQDITITGKVIGNIECRNATLNGADIEGNIHCGERITISEQTIIHGDIDAQNMECSGRIKGNTHIEDAIVFTQNAAIVGNITTNELSIDRGAIVLGTIMITKEIDI